MAAIMPMSMEEWGTRTGTIHPYSPTIQFKQIDIQTTGGIKSSEKPNDQTQSPLPSELQMTPKQMEWS